MYFVFCVNCLELNGLLLFVFIILGILNELIILFNIGIVVFVDSEKFLRILIIRYFEYLIFIINSF